MKRFTPPIWVLPLAIAGLAAVFGWWGNNRLRSTIEGQLTAQLTATLSANVTALGIWSTNQTRLATALAEDPIIRSSANAILAMPASVRHEYRPHPELEEFVNELWPRLPRLGYRTAQLVNTNFLIVANSARAQFAGNNLVSDTHTNKFAQLFESGEPVIITPFRPELLIQRRAARNFLAGPGSNYLNHAFYRRPEMAGRGRRGDLAFMQVAAPVRNNENRVMGALAMIIDPDKEFSRILSVARSGQSGETYAFDQTGLMISHSRFDEQLKQIGLLDPTNTTSALNLRLRDPGGDLTRGYKPDSQNEQYARPLTRLVASAVEGEDEVDVTPWPDYRGVPVVGASCWLPQFGFGVATQIDADESYRPLRVLQLVFAALVLSLLLCATGMFVYSYANLAWRERLNQAELKLKQLGQYTLEEKIGEGGMGVVYRARHAMLRRDTAVKLLVPELAGAPAVERFEREVCMTCRLTHPNTIQVYDYGHTPEGIFYYAMEYLDGVNLHDLVARYGPLPEGRVVHILTQICDSLAEAHALGLIHRDIKPGNIFLGRRGGIPDFVKVLDFGLVHDYRAAASEPAATAPGPEPRSEKMIEGTPWFMPPEAIQGNVPVDPRSDLYSVGALGYFLLTGHYVFDGANIAEIQEKQLSAAPIPAGQRSGNPVSPEMERCLMGCLEKDMTLRPQSAGELKSLLLDTPRTAEWTLETAEVWWAAASATVSGQEFPTPDPSQPMGSVNIDLSSRIE